MNKASLKKLIYINKMERESERKKIQNKKHTRQKRSQTQSYHPPGLLIFAIFPYFSNLHTKIISPKQKVSFIAIT